MKTRHRLVLGSLALLLGFGTNAGHAAGVIARVDRLCAKSNAPFGLVETDLSRKLKALVGSLHAPKTRVNFGDIQVFGPSKYCTGPYSPELETIRAKVRMASDEEARGNRARAQQLRAEARTELAAFRRTLSARGSISVQVSGLTQGGGKGGSSSNGADANMDGYMRDSLETARTAQTVGDEQAAQESIDEAGQKYEQWSEKEQTRMREEASAQADIGHIDPGLLQDLMDMARTNQLLRDNVAGQQDHLAKLGNILAKRFKRMAKNMPCPPNDNALNDLAEAGRMAENLGADPAMIEATMRPHVENYIRQQVQGADYIKTRLPLAKLAQTMGLNQLYEDLYDRNKPIDPPDCKKNAWSGTILYQRQQSRTSSQSKQASKPNETSESITGNAKETYTATITVPESGPAQAQATYHMSSVYTTTRQGRINCVRPAIARKDNWKDWNFEETTTTTYTGGEAVTPSYGASAKNGQVEVSFVIPRFPYSTTAASSQTNSGGCGKSSSTSDSFSGKDMTLPEAYRVKQTISAEDPDVLTGSFSDEKAGVTISWNLRRRPQPGK